MKNQPPLRISDYWMLHDLVVDFVSKDKLERSVYLCIIILRVTLKIIKLNPTAPINTT